MPLCRVQNCNTNSGKGIPMHRFPYKNDPERARQWLIRCKIFFGEKPMDIYKYDFQHKVICGRHFAPDAYKPVGDCKKQELLGVSPKRELKDDAMPTLHLPSNSASSSVTRSRKRVSIRNLFVTKKLNSFCF